ncbi:MAG: hypothetical protein ABI967_05640 [bacterium]
MTICPCCGFKFEGTLSEGCTDCGARSVGEALPKPENELPSYARALVLTVTGALMVLLLGSQTIIALMERSPRTPTTTLALSSIIPLDFWMWMGAAETAAWRLKWVALPLTIVVLWGTRKIYLSMLQTPDRFCGLNYARKGLIASAIVPVMIAVLIGITVPARLRQHQEGIEAGNNAQGYRIDRALIQYREQYATLPSDLKDLARLPDPDGSLARALQSVDVSGYKTSADVAVLPKRKPTLRGAVIRNASLNTAADDLPGDGLSFTNYELRLPGADMVLGTEDDLLLRDGIINKAADLVKRQAAVTASKTKK